MNRQEKLFVYQVHSMNKDYNFEVYGVSSMIHPIDHTIMFLTPKNLDEAIGMERCRECLIFVPEDFQQYDGRNGHCIIKCQNPRKSYAELVNSLISSEDNTKVYERNGSWISDQAIIGEGTIVDPGCYIGSKVVIGENCHIYPGVKIHGPVTIGNNVIVRDNSLIGILGFGFVNGERKEKIRFPFLGSVVIKDDVEIGALCNIEKGIIDETVLDQGAKIDVGTIIGHDSFVGKNTLIVCARIAGHVQIGEGCFIGMGANVKPRVKMGNGCTVGVGAAVVKDILEGMTVVGVPAEPLVKHSR